MSQGKNSQDVDTTLRLVRNVQKHLQDQFSMYMDSMKLVLEIKKELKSNPALKEQFNTPDKMNAFLKQRGLPEKATSLLTDEEFQTGGPAGVDAGLACLCTSCCISVTLETE